MGDTFINLVNNRDFLKLAELGIATAGVQLIAGCTVIAVTAAAGLATDVIKSAVGKLQAQQQEPNADQA